MLRWPIFFTRSIAPAEMHVELASLYHCAVPFLSRAGTNVYCYYYTDLMLLWADEDNDDVIESFSLLYFSVL